VDSAALNWLGGPNAAGISSSAAMSAYTICLVINDCMLTGARSSGPPMGVLMNTMRATAAPQQASGAAPRSSKTRQLRGAVLVRSATWMVASAMPTPNQMAKLGRR
jgi:hypothetical protein